MTEEPRQGSKLGPYELLLTVGRGGMAAVWVARERAHSGKDDRLVAMKVMLAELADEGEFVKMFLDEVELLRSIRHPNVVEVYDAGQSGGVMWMAMEWVEGESLHTVIAEAGKRRAIPPELAVRIIADAAAGVHAAHELRDNEGNSRGLVHRDISPHNILIGAGGAVKLVDFGVAKAVGRISEATRAGQLKGKFGYMSPEQALGHDLDRRSDIFGLGIVLFELTTSRRLFRGETDLDTLKQVTTGVIPKPTSIDPNYPAELERIVLTALERNRGARYQSAAEFEHDLRAYLTSERLIVPQSGVAGLLKRVLGERIELRRKGLRMALEAVGSGALSGAELLSNEPAFTPTSVEPPLPVDGVEPGPRNANSVASDSVGAARVSSFAVVHLRSLGAALLATLQRKNVRSYAIAAASLAIVVVVLILLR